MTLLADIVLAPGGIIAWLLVGLIAGVVAGLLMRGGGYGIVADIVIGLIGAMLGGLIFGLFATGIAGFWGSVGVAIVGACVLIAIMRLLSPGAPAV